MKITSNLSKNLSKLSYLKLKENLVLIPGANPGPLSLCGTNIFLIGN